MAGDQFDGLLVKIVPILLRHRFERHRLGQGLAAAGGPGVVPVVHQVPNLFIGYVGPLQSHGLGYVAGEEEHVASSQQLLRPTLVQDGS